MSEQDEKASYIDLLEEQLAKAEEEIGLLRMEAEHEAIQRDHELAWYMEWNRNLDEQGGCGTDAEVTCPECIAAQKKGV